MLHGPVFEFIASTMKPLHFLFKALLVFTSTAALAQTPAETSTFNAQATSIVSGNLTLVNQNYSGYTGGSSDRASFMAAGGMSSFVNILNQNVEFRINVPSVHRHRILSGGYLNQHQTGTTNGCLCPDNRNAKEAALINWPKNRYEQLSPYIKPKYGSMGIAGSTLMGASSYGDDIYILDENKLKGRLTYTLADSLGIGSQYFNYQNPLFIPYEFPELVLQLLSKSTPANAGAQIYANGYTEIQIWGVLRMDSLKEFRFSQSPPDDNLATYLLQNGIRIRKVVCTGRAIGDESCLKDYIAPTVGKLLSLLKAGDEAGAVKEVQTVISTGVNPSTVYSALESSKKDWFLTQISALTDIKSQKPENWFSFIELIKKDGKNTKALVDLLIDSGDAEQVVRHWLAKKMPESDLPTRISQKLISYNLDPALIQQINKQLPTLAKALQKQVENLLTTLDFKKVDALSSSILFSYMPAAIPDSAVAQAVMARIAKKENPFTLFSLVRPEIKGAVLKNIGSCLSSDSCAIPQGASGTYLALAYAEILKTDADGAFPKKLWLQYFSELSNSKTFKNLPSITDMAGFSRERKNAPQRFYRDLLAALDAATKAPAIVPFEVILDMQKDRAGISNDLLQALSKKLQQIPHQSLFFTDAGMTAPAVPTFYYIAQIRDEHIKMPEDLYPISLMIARLAERSTNDVNTNTYRLALTNLRQMFTSAKDTRAHIDETFDAIDEVVAPQYRYIFRQMRHQMDFQFKQSLPNFMAGVEKDLKGWSKMTAEEKDLYVKGLDIVPLLVLEQMKDNKITKDYLKTVNAYLASDEFKKFEQSEAFKKFTADRAGWSNYYADRRIDNKVDDFKAKLAAMTKAM